MRSSNNRIDQTEERIFELVNRDFDITKLEGNKEKKLKRKKVYSRGPPPPGPVHVMC